jgi:dTDP-4-dehydrorhamnose 3,5-epimerase
MPYIATSFKDLWVFEPKVFEDSRGYFFESFNQQQFEQATHLPIQFVQDNQSLSQYGVVRGLHMQWGEAAQAKLVRALSGTVLDIVVDIRPKSITFGKSFSIELSGENKKQLFIPRGFLHGFVVLSEQAEFFYKCDGFSYIFEKPKLHSEEYTTFQIFPIFRLHTPYLYTIPFRCWCEKAFRTWHHS